MKQTLQLGLQEEQYKAVLAQYHFRETDLERLRDLGGRLLYAAEPVLYYAPCRVLGKSALEGAGAETEGMEAASAEAGLATEAPESAVMELEPVPEEQVQAGITLAVAVSLGENIDILQNEYISRECLTEAYMIECIGMELLKNAYELAAEKIRDQYGLWTGGFEFLGERYPLEMTGAVLGLLAPDAITYNAAYMLMPKKTVVFMTTLQEERRNGYCHVCDTCSNLRCPNRINAVHLNYGYQRIFGKL
ncbi:MAG: hypothetical protein J6A08_02010 [Lachnospiraceae bacterium]|nr:hypothetical protein [Lachnospiraceae bacterium]